MLEAIPRTIALDATSWSRTAVFDLWIKLPNEH